jgi:hypothetical protein
VGLVRTDVSEQLINYIIKAKKMRDLGTKLAVEQRASVYSYCSLNHSTLMIEAIRSSEPSVLKGAKRRHIAADGIHDGNRIRRPAAVAQSL